MLKELDLHLTNRCTSKCIYCCFSSSDVCLSELPLNKLQLVMDEAHDLGCEYVHFTGGEPLIRQDILDIVKYATSLGMKTRMQTNGELLTNEMANNLIKFGLNSIMISLDSDSPECHEANRGEQTWKNAVSAIKIALSSGMTVRVNSVITKTNMDKIFETIMFVADLGVENYSAFYFSPIGSGKNRKNIWLSPREYFEFWCELQEKIEATPKLKNMNIVIEKGYASWKEASEIDISNFTGCGGGCLNTYNNRDYLIVRSDGNVYPCIMAIDSEPLGNINDVPLREIHRIGANWEKLKPSGILKCSKCEHFVLCGEGCRYYPKTAGIEHDERCIDGELVPLCPIMKYNSKNNKLGGSSDDVMEVIGN